MPIARKTLITAVLALDAVVVLVTGALGAVGWSASSQLMHPKRLAYTDDPAKYGLTPGNVRISTPNAQKPLSGWFFWHPNDHGQAILFIHGWGSHKRHMLRDYLRWLAARYTVLAFDLTNHGESPDGLTTLGPRELKDAQAALNWLDGRHYQRVGVLGTSMGGAVAIDLASQDPTIRAVVTDGAFARPQDVPVRHFAEMGLPFPSLLSDVSVWMVGLRAGEDESAAAAVDHVAKIAPRPLLLIHGEADHVIDVAEARELYAAAGEPKTLWTVPGADHMSEMDRCPHALAPAEYERRVEGLFDALK